MWAFFIATEVAVVLAVAWLLLRYPSRTVPLPALIVAAYAYLMSLSIIALVPIDVWATLHRIEDTKPIEILWDISYWSTQALTWFFIPFFMGYAAAGDFTVLGRMRTSLQENGKFWLLMVFAAVAGFVGLVMSGRVSWVAVTRLGVTLSNTYGLLAGIVLLGYGLVELPRLLWWRSCPESQLRMAQHRVGKMAKRVDDTLQRMEYMVAALVGVHRTYNHSDRAWPKVLHVYNYAEKWSPIKPSQRQSVDVNDLTLQQISYGDDEVDISRLNRDFMAAMDAYIAARVRYELAVHDALKLEDIMKARSARRYDHPLTYDGQRVPFFKRMRWMYRCLVDPWLMKILAFVFACMSCLVVWSEATIGFESVDLSPFSKAIHAAEWQQGEWTIQLLVAVPLAYVCVCSYLAMFRVEFLSVYQLTPRGTPAWCLLLSSSLTCRFAAPISWNFLHAIRMHQRINDEMTTFARMMNNLQDVPFLKTSFNQWFPITLVVHVLLVLLGVWNRLFQLCLPRDYQFDDDTGEDSSSSRGRECLRREREALAGDAAWSRSFASRLATLPTSSSQTMLRGMTTSSAAQQPERSAHGSGLQYGSRYAAYRAEHGSNSSLNSMLRADSPGLEGPASGQSPAKPLFASLLGNVFPARAATTNSRAAVTLESGQNSRHNAGNRGGSRLDSLFSDLEK